MTPAKPTDRQVALRVAGAHHATTAARARTANLAVVDRVCPTCSAATPTVEQEQAIRRDERDRLHALIAGDDLRRIAHLLNRVLANPATTHDERQRIARIVPDPERRQLRALLDGDLRRFALFLAALVENLDPTWKDTDAD